MIDWYTMSPAQVTSFDITVAGIGRTSKEAPALDNTYNNPYQEDIDSSLAQTYLVFIFPFVIVLPAEQVSGNIFKQVGAFW